MTTMPGLLVIGTDTGVGKTVVACGLARALLLRGVKVGVMKPVASGALRTHAGLVSEDARLLREAARAQYPMEWLNPVALEPPLAPVPAARLSGATVSLAAVEQAFRRIRAEHEVVIVEGIGGLLVPLVRGVTIAELGRRWGLTAVAVARTTLGTVNHTLLTIESARRRGLTVLGVVFNRAQGGPLGDDEMTGPAEVAAESGVADLGCLPRMDTSGGLDFDVLAAACERHLRVGTILSALRGTPGSDPSHP
jgi:dethiobiotin synthetase